MLSRNIYLFNPDGTFEVPDVPELRLVGLRGKKGRLDTIGGLERECPNCDETVITIATMEEILGLSAVAAVTQRKLYSVQERGRLDLADRMTQALYAYSHQDALDEAQTYHFDWQQRRHRNDWLNP